MKKVIIPIVSVVAVIAAIFGVAGAVRFIKDREAPRY